MKVHPRIRGEDYPAEQLHPVCMGSPPHTRGRSQNDYKTKRLNGFTPAYAGKIVHGKQGLRQAEVHPRIRGEDTRRRLRSTSVSGSPPHTRGRLPPCPSCSVRRGFTPAYAGKIAPPAGAGRESQVHPRIRGEDAACGSPGGRGRLSEN